MEKQYKFEAGEIEKQISHLSEKGITEFTVHDEQISRDKRQVLNILNLFAQKAPEVYLNFLVQASVIDREVCMAASGLFCCFDIPLVCTEKNGRLLFDKKFYASKARLLNQFELVFGFQLTYAQLNGDSLKGFLDRLDFSLQQYPNHIEFPQLEVSQLFEEKVTGFFSAKDIRYARDIAFSVKTFYSEGRAVPWFLAVLKPLRIYTTAFLADFAEWQRCNNCDFKSGFVPEKEKHASIEKMQLLFLAEKYEEKGQHSLIPLVTDVVKINGVMARLAGEGEEAVLETQYNPEDLLSPEALDLKAFAENICMENSKTRFYLDRNGEPQIEAL